MRLRRRSARTITERGDLLAGSQTRLRPPERSEDRLVGAIRRRATATVFSITAARRRAA
jgi:hypothetical protein